MDKARQKEIASKGGKAAHAKGTAHEFDSAEAREAGRKGGLAVSENREHMARIGRRGGEAKGFNKRAGERKALTPEECSIYNDAVRRQSVIDAAPGLTLKRGIENHGKEA